MVVKFYIDTGLDTKTNGIIKMVRYSKVREPQPLALSKNRKYRQNCNFCFSIPKIFSSLGSNTKALGSTWFAAKWNRNRPKTSTKMSQMQVIPWNPRAETLVARRRNHNWGTRTATLYSGTVGTEAWVPKPGLNWKSVPSQH